MSSKLGKQLDRTMVKIGEHKITACVTAVVSALNLIGLLSARRFTAALFFGVVAALMHHFTKNTTVVLLVALVATNFLVYNRTLREGMTSGDGDSDSDAEDSGSDAGDGGSDAGDDGTLEAKVLAADPTATKAGAEAKLASAKSKAAAAGVTAPTSATKKSGATEKFTAASLKNAAPVNSGPGRAPRVDYASTMESAYDNLDRMLGSDSIRQLSGDTQKLMANQQKLFDTMKTMEPALASAKQMLQGLDMGGLNDIVTGMKINSSN